MTSLKGIKGDLNGIHKPRTELSFSLRHYKLHILSVMRYRGPEGSQVTLEEWFLTFISQSLISSDIHHVVFLQSHHDVDWAVKGYFTEFHHTEPDSQYVWWWEGIKSWMCVKRRRVKMKKKANLEQNRWTNKHRENTTTGSGWDIVWQKAMAHWEIDANNMQMMQAMKSAGEENILVKK